jgi:hypothetical protein
MQGEVGKICNALLLSRNMAGCKGKMFKALETLLDLCNLVKSLVRGLVKSCTRGKIISQPE